LAISKQETQMFDVEIFNLRQLIALEVRKQFHIKDSNKFAAKVHEYAPYHVPS